jgi:DNA-binding response OmpR family regulator
VTPSPRTPIIWILEDREEDRFLYGQALDLSYTTRMFGTIEELTRALSQEKDQPDLLLLDVMLPGQNLIKGGVFSFKTDIPFMVISSLADIDVIRKCLESSAVDYFVKPFPMVLLQAKIEQYFHKHLPQSRPAVVLDFSTLTVRCKGAEPVQLTPMQFKIVKLLTEHPDHAVSRMHLVKTVYENQVVHEKALDTHLSMLRKKLQPLRIDVRSVGKTGIIHLVYI